MKPIGIVLHCSGTPHGKGHDAEAIHNQQLTQKGFSGIGYHYVILEDGRVQEGRPEYWKGSHTKGYNDYIGICMIGDDSFTEEQFEAQADLIAGIDKRHRITHATAADMVAGIDKQDKVGRLIKGYYELRKARPGAKQNPPYSVYDFKKKYLPKYMLTR